MPRVYLNKESQERMANQKPEPHRKRTFLKWATDRDWLDRGRPMPCGSEGIPAQLRAVDPKLFLAWNSMLWRWELWRDHTVLKGSEAFAWYADEPYFVNRVSLHPNVYDELGRCIKPCAMRPPRFAKGWPLQNPHKTDPSKLYIVYHKDCPKHCPGIFQNPDERLVRTVRQMQLNIDGRLEAIQERWEWERFLEQQKQDNYLTRHTENIVSHNLTRTLSIQSVGYTGKEMAG